MMEFQFATLENVKTSDLIAVFNATFADYFVNVELDERGLAIKSQTENTDLSKSVGAFLDGKLVGFILLGIENGIAFNGGTGVLPDARGNALTVKMYDFMMPKLKTESIYFHQLEVITKNLPAIKTYKKIGFRRVRTLACFKGKINATKINRDIEIKFLNRIDTEIFPTFWNAQPSRQNSLSALQRTQNLYKYVGAFYQSNLVGYIIYGKKGSIKQFAVKKDFRHLGIGQTLFAFVQNELENKESIITNIDKNDFETILFLEQIGLNLFIEQFEMKK